MQQMEIAMFNITDGKGFHLTLANGWTVSVQFGYGNYCDNQSRGDYRQPAEPSRTAEIAARHKNDVWYEFESGDTVDGWKSADEVAAFIAMIASKESTQ